MVARRLHLMIHLLRFDLSLQIIRAVGLPYIEKLGSGRNRIVRDPRELRLQIDLTLGSQSIEVKDADVIPHSLALRHGIDLSALGFTEVYTSGFGQFAAEGQSLLDKAEMLAFL